MDKMCLAERIKAELVSYNGKMGVYLNDFKGNIIEINADEPFEAASSIKTYILADLFKQVSQGKKDLNEILSFTKDNMINGSGVIQSLDFGLQMTVKNFATLMIIVSDNVATNVLIEYLGIDHINQTIRELGLCDTVLHNKIDFKKYPKLGTTTPRDYGKIFEMIAKGELINLDASNQMLDIFKKQHYNSMITRKFPQALLETDDNADAPIWVASKSGSMNQCRNDGGIVSTPYGKYITVTFNKDFSDPLYYADHDSTLYGANVNRLILDQYLALQGRFA